MTTIHDILQTFIYPLVFLCLGYWIHLLRHAIRAQDQTIKIQADGIKAQGDMIKTVQAAFETLDTPKMLERFKAFTGIVEQVKDATLEQQKLALVEQHKLATAQQMQKVEELADNLILGVIDLFGDSVAYIPAEKRKEILDASNLRPAIKKGLLQLANSAPDYSLGAFLAKVGRPPTLHAEGPSEAIAALLAPIPEGNQNI